ncbi:hypothetical protein F5B20DRAFT_88812 [Whalleya microplaca]|nr:hypothetical protein F5B20DRAFT_88812 [Whalleya microplaca]
MAHLTQEHVQHLYDTFGEINVLDDIIRCRAADDPPVPILAYPRTYDSVDDYEFFTGKQLDQYVDSAVKNFIGLGLVPNAHEVAAILAPSNVDFIVTLFALSRLGYTVLCLSLRIPSVAIVNLLRQTNCNLVFYGEAPLITDSLEAASHEKNFRSLPMPTRLNYARKLAACELPFVRVYDSTVERDCMALIMHSSGSTGLPKAVMLTHRNVLTHAVQGTGMNNFAALPLYHMYGISTTLQAMYMRKTAHLFNTSLPLTANNLIAALSAVKAEVIHVVPYALGLIAEQRRGIEYLKACKVVTAAGARTPDELGDRLVAEGINLGVVFGTTEAGLLGDTMRRNTDDDSWNYIRIYSNVRKYICMDPIGDNQFECVYLQGHPGLSTSNSDDPAPASWRSKDIFVPHPTIPDAWKYITRIDDRITLVNGEKVLPLAIEGRIREDELVREAVVVGVGKPIPGLLLFRSHTADHLSDKSFREAVWPIVEEANCHAEGFSQITPEMIYIFSSSTNYPRTDKGSIIRAQVYREFSKEIEDMYVKLDGKHEGNLKLSLPALEEFICNTYKNITGKALNSMETDFFSAGLDSLKAIQMRRILQGALYLNGRKLGINVVYDYQNVRGLARYLFSLSRSRNIEQGNSQALMEQLIERYSRPADTVLLTGATGSLGAHILAQMVNRNDVSKVYCLVRGPDPMHRVIRSLNERYLKIGKTGEQKIIAIESDLAKPCLGLEDPAFVEQLKAEITLIIHIAWPVNFNIHLLSFEPQLEGLRNLLELSVSVHRPEPARLLFCSSISTATNTPGPVMIRDAAISKFSQVSSTGYAQSKFVAEHMVLNAARKGARSYVLRIGQIVGDTTNGVWNDNEFVPSIIHSALTLKMLPILQDHCSWLPVDTMATAILQLSETLGSAPRPYSVDTHNPPIFYNMVNPHIFSWVELLRELKTAGLQFDIVPVQNWLSSLQRYADSGEEKTNPTVKLLHYFETQYGSRNATSSEVGKAYNTVYFETKGIQKDSNILKIPPRCIEDGYVKKFVSTWLQKWLA